MHTPTEPFMPVQDKRKDPYVIRPVIFVKPHSIMLMASQGKGELKTYDIIYEAFKGNGIEAVYKHEGEYYKGVIYPAKPEKK